MLKKMVVVVLLLLFTMLFSVSKDLEFVEVTGNVVEGLVEMEVSLKLKSTTPVMMVMSQINLQGVESFNEMVLSEVEGEFYTYTTIISPPTSYDIGTIVFYPINQDTEQIVSDEYNIIWKNGSSINNSITNKYELYQNYPNPFNPSSNISYSIIQNGHVKINVYDHLGNFITNLVNDYKFKGQYNIEFNGENLISGVYYYSIKVNNYHKVMKATLIK